MKTRTRARMMKRLKLRRDRRGVTLIELLVALIVLATASVGTTIAFFTAYGSLQQQRHRMRANEFLRAEVEYWQGRIHTGVTDYERQQPTLWDDVIIDPKGPGSQDDIVGSIRRESIQSIDVITTPQRPDFYTIPVVITWYEPSMVPGEAPVPITLSLVGYWVPSTF